MAKFDPVWKGYPVWQTRPAALAGHPYHLSCKRDQIKMSDYVDLNQESPTSMLTGPNNPADLCGIVLFFNAKEGKK